MLFVAGLAFIDKVPDYKNCCYDTNAPKQYADGGHGFNSLSIINMNINNIIHEYIPPVNIQSGKGVEVMNFPNTVVTNIAVSMLINILAQFSRCLLSKSTLKQYHEILTNHTIL